MSGATDTLLAHAGREPQQNFGIINPPVFHASTVLYANLAAFDAAHHDFHKGVHYGRLGTPTTFALEEAIRALEGGHGAVAVCSGLSAIVATILSFAKAGDEILMADTVYGPTRRLATTTLASFGIVTRFYDPMVGAGIAALIGPQTRIVYMESPGSLTFEIQDVPAIVAACRGLGITTILDNTWAAPLFLQPLALGVDVSVIAGTKYVSGHSDAMMGLIVCNERTFADVRRTVTALGLCAGPDDCYLVLRGLRTVGLRLRQHERQATALVDWLKRRPEIVRVLHPREESHPGHAVWRRDFSGASGLFSVVTNITDRAAIARMVDGFRLFGIGFSWGGFESLVLPADPAATRSATTWRAPGIVLRLHAGLEDIDDLIRDLRAGFDRLHAA